MGLFDLFGSSKKVSITEFKDARSRLYAKGFSESQINDIKKIFRADVLESGVESGIDVNELDRGIKWMKENMGNHSLSPEKIATLESVLKEKL